MSLRQHYIYVWKEDKFGLPFYIGQGRHSGYSDSNKKKYLRSITIHYNDKKRKTLAYCQNVANKLKTNHIVEILYDNLTLEEVNKMESLLIKRLGRRNNGTGILCNLTDGGDVNPMDDISVKSKHKQIMKSPEYLAKQKCKSITVDGVEYYSKREAARKLGISRQLLKYRLNAGIPLSLNVSHGNRRGTDFE